MTLNATETETPLHLLSEEALRGARQGCTEHSCMYHGEYNREIARRGLPR